MTRTEFARRLHEAALRTLAYARELIVNDVPDEYRFDIRIVPHGPEREHIVDPLLVDLWKRSHQGLVRELTTEQAAADLCHEERVPEWIDISLEAIELPEPEQHAGHGHRDRERGEGDPARSGEEGQHAGS